MRVWTVFRLLLYLGLIQVVIFTVLGVAALYWW